LPILVDAEEVKSTGRRGDKAPAAGERRASMEHKQFWMPDKLCKTCYHCEEIFTVYKRKHHCRMCGQVGLFACLVSASGSISA
jgi:hypothetical protein